MWMGFLDRPCLAGEASCGCICCSTVVYTKTLLAADSTGWVGTGGASLPLAGSCGGGGAGEGEGGTLPTAALLRIGTLLTRGGARETRAGLGCSRWTAWHIEYDGFIQAYLFHIRIQDNNHILSQGL